MHDHGTAQPFQPEGRQVSPVIGGPRWLDDDERPRPLLLQLHQPISAGELVTALYDDDYLSPGDLDDDEHVWGYAAAAILRDGLAFIELRAAEIRRAERDGTLASPDWLATCRRRVAEVTGCSPAVPAGPTGRPGTQRLDAARSSTGDAPPPGSGHQARQRALPPGTRRHGERRPQ